MGSTADGVNRRRGFPHGAAGGVFGGVMLMGLASSCAPKAGVMSEPAPAAFRQAPVYDGSGRPVSESIGQSGLSSDQVGPTLVHKLRLSSPGQGAGEPVARAELAAGEGELIRVQYQTRNAEASEVVRVLLKEYLGRDYVLDPKVTGAVSLEIDDEFTRAELTDLVSGMLGMFGWYVEEREGVAMVRPADRMPRSPAAPVLTDAPALESDLPALRVRRLRYLAPDQAATTLKDLLPEGSKALAMGRSIVIADSTRQIARVSKLLAALDTPGFEGVEVWTYRLAHRRPEDAQSLLEKLATGTTLNSGSENTTAFVPVSGTQRLMVIARDASVQPLLQELLREIDRPADGEKRRRYRYSIQHFPQDSLVKMLSEFFADKIESSAAGAGAAAPLASGEPGLKIRIVSDPKSDVLLIYATPSDYAEVLSVLTAIDRAPQQVVIQSIIAEVRLTNSLEFGVEYFLSTQSSLGSLELTGNTPLQAASVATGGAFFIGGDGFAVIQALDRESSAKILSQPKMVIADRSTGSIQVGGEVPTLRATQGASSQQGGSSDIRQEIEYRDTGVLLDLQPSISESGTVTIKIKQEVKDALPTDIPNQPEFTSRLIDTTVVVPSGHTVLLGGIIIDDSRQSADRIPLLGRIPVVGEVFSNKSDSTRRTELVLALTPTIVNEPSDLRGELTEFLQSVAGVRSALLDLSTDLPEGSLHDLQSPAPIDPPAEAPEAPEVEPEAGEQS